MRSTRGHVKGVRRAKHTYDASEAGPVLCDDLPSIGPVSRMSLGSLEVARIARFVLVVFTIAYEKNLLDKSSFSATCRPLDISKFGRLAL